MPAGPSGGIGAASPRHFFTFGTLSRTRPPSTASRLLASCLPKPLPSFLLPSSPPGGFSLSSFPPQVLASDLLPRLPRFRTSPPKSWLPTSFPGFLASKLSPLGAFRFRDSPSRFSFLSFPPRVLASGHRFTFSLSRLGTGLSSHPMKNRSLLAAVLHT